MTKPKKNDWSAFYYVKKTGSWRYIGRLSLFWEQVDEKLSDWGFEHFFNSSKKLTWAQMSFE